MDNKWWEYYTVRYFVGTVVGAVFVSFLNGYPGSIYEWSLSTFGDFNDSKFLGIGLLAALGFAFCYIASAPVLTLHATRAHFQFSALKKRWGISSALLILSVILSSWGAWQLLPPAAALVVGIVIGIQIGFVLLAAFTGFAVVEEFYRKLATVRAKAMPTNDIKTTPGSEFVTSYRHLREHGNAFVIVLFEGILAYALFHLPSTICAFYLLVAWLLPAASVWLIGTVLESRLASTPLEPS